MEEQNKYYTPTIDEFYVGFEYEYYEQCLFDLPDKKTPIWINKVFGNEYEELDSVAYDITQTPSTIRVKYLDKEDIESLGWEYREVSYKERDAAGNIITITRNGYFKGDWYLSYFNESYKHIIMIREETELSEYPEMRFLGTIKNKSELKKLLKQLGINE